MNRTPEEIEAMLRARASIYPEHAAVHLLVFTELAHTHPAILLDHLHVYEAYDHERGCPVPAAKVKDWDALTEALGSHVGGGLRRVLTLAAALDTGKPVDLNECLMAGGIGHATARAMIEAVIIASGRQEWFTLEPTAKYHKQQADNAAFLASARAGE